MTPASARLSTALSLALLATLAACAPPAEIRALPYAPAGPAPVLLPLDQVMAQASVPSDGPARADGLAERAARLRARAALMRAPVHDPATRARLAQAIAQGRA